MIAARSDKERRIQLTSSNYSTPARHVRALLLALRFSIALLHRETCIHPCDIAAEQCRCVLYTGLFQVKHRTGACVLVRSRTVRDDRLIAGQLLYAPSDIGHPERPLDVAYAKGFLSAHINHDSLALLH